MNYKKIVLGLLCGASLTISSTVGCMAAEGTPAMTQPVEGGQEAVSIFLSDEKIECDSSAVEIDGSVLTISSEGVYLLSGSLSNGQILVDTEGKVQLVLDHASITCTNSAAIYVRSADKVFLTLAEGSQNTIVSRGEFSEDGETKVDAAVFSKDDLTVNGSGSLTLQTEQGDGIVSKDDLKVTGGTLSIQASGHGLSGKDSVSIADGSLTITAGKDGIHSENSDDAEKGTVYLAGGEITISAEDDGIHAESALTVDGGSLSVLKSYEGLEGKVITINDGKISVVSSDDGINASDGSGSSGGFGKNGTNPYGHEREFSGEKGGKRKDFDGQMPSMEPPMGADGFSEATPEMPADQGEMDPGAMPVGNDFRMMPGQERTAMGNGSMGDNGIGLYIHGGEIEVDAEGDGLDSNGFFEMTGGTVYVSGPSRAGNGALDYEAGGSISGGTIVAVGAAGMDQGFSADSVQSSIRTMAAQGSGEIQLLDESGQLLVSYTPTKTYSSVLISCPQLQEETTYTLITGQESRQVVAG